MSPSIHRFWRRRPIARCGFVFAIWIGANLLALAGIDRYEAERLADEFDVPASIIRQYEPRTIQLQTADSQAPISLRYRFRPPGFWAGHHGVPLLVFLHGSGERGFDNVRQLRSVPRVMCEPAMKAKFPCAVLAPQCPEDFNWSSPINSETDMLDVLLRMIDDVLHDTRIDPQRVYLVGFSMGGYGSWSLAARTPERFAAVVPIAGGGDRALATRLIDVPIWAVHGADDEVVPVTQSEEMIRAIREAGGNPQLSEPAGVGHSAWHVVFRQDSQVLEWVFRQTERGNSHSTP